MRTSIPLITAGLLIAFAVQTFADRLDMQNGDRYFGKIVSMSGDTVVLQSDVLGRINVPRDKVANISLGVNGTARQATPATQSAPSIAQTNLDLSASLRGLGSNTNFIAQIRDQMLGSATPEAKQKYDELVGGMLSGKLNLSDIRREAKSSADQLRALKKELGPEAGESLDMYLQVLDSFLSQTTDSSAPAGKR